MSFPIALITIISNTSQTFKNSTSEQPVKQEIVTPILEMGDWGTKVLIPVFTFYNDGGIKR